MEEVLAGHPDVAECAVIGVSDGYPGMDGYIFAKKKRHAARIFHIDVDILRWFDQHALERDIQQVAAPFLMTALHQYFCGKRDATIITTF